MNKIRLLMQLLLHSLCINMAVNEEVEIDYEDNSEQKGFAVKVICLGDGSVGKSKLVERFLVNEYQPHQISTYALNLMRHHTIVDGEPITVDIWDTAGQEMFQSMHPSYYHQAHACILVFDATRKTTYKNLLSWYTELRQFRPNIPVLCAANKIDANMEVVKKTFALPAKFKIPLHYVSASDGTNVVKLFKDAIQAAVAYKKNPTDLTDQIMEELDRP